MNENQKVSTARRLTIIAGLILGLSLFVNGQADDIFWMSALGGGILGIFLADLISVAARR